MSRNVAVIDVGSNSIKLLVARSGTPNGITQVFAKTIETRIGAGIGSAVPQLSDTAIEAGCGAISRLVDLARDYEPGCIQIVATSAVRDASNNADFIDAVRAKTGLEIRILKGYEEALYIGRGVAFDPNLQGKTDFIQVDLGGGSLELIRFEAGEIKQAISLQLGAVRLAERFLKDRNAAINQEEQAEIRSHVIKTISESNFDFEPTALSLVATGGSFVITRAILAGEEDMPIEDHSAMLTRANIISLKTRLINLSLAERLAIPHLPSSRADIVPVGLIIIEALLDYSGRNNLVHSFFNLRFGIAAELLATN